MGATDKRSSAAILALILIAAALLRAQDIDQPLVDAFSWREASTAMMADNFHQRSWNVLYPEVSWTGPGPSYQGREFQVVSYITALLYAAFGWHDWYGRAVAATFGVWGVFALHRLIARVWDRTHAHAGALMLAVAPGAVAIDRAFLPDPAMAALATTALWIFVAWLQTGRAALLVLATPLTALAILAKLPGVAMLAPMAYAAMVAARSAKAPFRPRPRDLLIALAGGVTPVVAYYLWAVHLAAAYPPHHVAGSGYVWEDVAHALRNRFFLRRGAEIAQSWFLTLPLAMLAAIGALASVARSPDSRPRALFHVWLAGGGLVFLAAGEEITNNPWNLHLFSAPMAALAGAGLVWCARLDRRERGEWLPLARAAALIAIVLWASAYSRGFMRAPYAQQGLELGRRLEALSRPGDLVVTAAPDIGDPIAVYYSRRRGWVFPPGGGDYRWDVLPDDATAVAQFEALRAQGADWFGAARNAKDAEGRRFLDHNRGLIAHLDRTATRAVDDPAVVIWRLGP